MTTLLSELAALEQSTDPEKREVGARLRTAIRNVLLDELAHAKVLEFLEDFPPTENPWDWEKYDELTRQPRWYNEPGWYQDFLKNAKV